MLNSISALLKTSRGRTWIVWGTLLVLWLATSWSLFHPSFFLVHDYVHAARVAELLRAVQEGHFPVRWSGNFGYGYGMPLFEFYAPLPFYVGALFYWLGLPMVMVLKILWAGCSAVTIGGGYKLGKELWGKSGGLVLAAALGLAPYRAVNLFVRGSLSEAWGIMAMPWIMVGGIGVIKGKRWGWWTLVLGVVTLMLSHNLTTLMFVPISALLVTLYGLAQWWRSRRVAKPTIIKRWLVVVGSYILAGGVSAFYMLPALVEKDFTKIDNILSGYFHYSQHFLYLRQLITPGWSYGGSAWGPNDGISFFLGYGQWLGLVGAGVLLLWFTWHWGRNVNTKERALIIRNWAWFGVLATVLGGAVFMSLQRSQSVWDASPFLSFIQFPWRWLSVAIMIISLLLAWSLTLLKDKEWRWRYAALLVASIVVVNWSYFRPESYLSDAEEYYYVDPTRIQAQMSGILPDYIPKQMSDELTPPEALFLVPAGVEEKVEVLVDRGHERLLKTSLLSPIVLHFTIADFPGWMVEIDGKAVAKQSGENGGIAVEVPAGEHLVGAYFGSTPIRQWSDIISVISVVVFLVGVVALKPVESQLDASPAFSSPVSSTPTKKRSFSFRRRKKQS